MGAAPAIRPGLRTCIGSLSPASVGHSSHSPPSFKGQDGQIPVIGNVDKFSVLFSLQSLFLVNLFSFFCLFVLIHSL